MDVELIELLVDVENLVNWNWILVIVIVMWIVIEKWWILEVIMMNCWELIELCLCWELCDWERCWEMRCWEMKCWDVDDGRMNWAFEIVDLRCDDLECNCWAMWIACVWW